MTLVLPPFLPPLLVTLAAGHFPEGDEDALRHRLAEAWDYSKAQLNELADLQAERVGPVAEAVVGEAGTAAAEGMGAAEQHLRDLAVFFQSLSQQVKTAARDIEFEKLVVIFTLSILAVQLALAVAFPGGALVALARWLTAKKTIQSVYLQLLTRLVLNGTSFLDSQPVLSILLRGGGSGAFQGGGADLAAQSVQIGVDTRELVDRQQLAVSTVSGFTSGVAGDLAARSLQPLTGTLGQTVGEAAGPHAQWVVELAIQAGAGGAAGAVVGAGTAMLMMGGDFGDVDLAQALFEGAAGGIIGAAGHALRPPANPPPGPFDKVPVVPSSPRPPGTASVYAEAPGDAASGTLSGTNGRAADPAAQQVDTANRRSEALSPSRGVDVPMLAQQPPSVDIGAAGESPIATASSSESRAAERVPDESGTAAADYAIAANRQEGGQEPVSSVGAEEPNGRAAAEQTRESAAERPVDAEAGDIAAAERGSSREPQDPEPARASASATTKPESGTAVPSPESPASDSSTTRQEMSRDVGGVRPAEHADTADSPATDVTRDQSGELVLAAGGVDGSNPPPRATPAPARPNPGRTPDPAEKADATKERTHVPTPEPTSAGLVSTVHAPSDRRRQQTPSGSGSSAITAPEHNDSPPKTEGVFDETASPPGEAIAVPAEGADPSSFRGSPTDTTEAAAASDPSETTPVRNGSYAGRETVPLDEYDPIEDLKFQQDLEDALKDAEGRIQVGADPRTNPYRTLINPGGVHRPGGGTNCVRTALRGLRAFLGVPLVSEPRRRHDDRTENHQLGDSFGARRAAAWAGKSFRPYTLDGPIAEHFQRLQDEVAATGPLSSALVGLQWTEIHPETGKPYRAGHLIVIVYPPGADAPVWWDPQSGATWDGPPAELMSFTEHLEAITLSPEEGLTRAVVPDDLPLMPPEPSDRAPTRRGDAGQAPGPIELLSSVPGPGHENVVFAGHSAGPDNSAQNPAWWSPGVPRNRDDVGFRKWLREELSRHKVGRDAFLSAIGMDGDPRAAHRWFSVVDPNFAVLQRLRDHGIVPAEVLQYGVDRFGLRHPDGELYQINPAFASELDPHRFPKFGDWLRATMESHGLTAADLMDTFKATSVLAVEKWLDNAKLPTPRQQAAICRHFGIPSAVWLSATERFGSPGAGRPVGAGEPGGTSPAPVSRTEVPGDGPAEPARTVGSEQMRWMRAIGDDGSLPFEDSPTRDGGKDNVFPASPVDLKRYETTDTKGHSDRSVRSEWIGTWKSMLAERSRLVGLRSSLAHEMADAAGRFFVKAVQYGLDTPIKGTGGRRYRSATDVIGLSRGEFETELQRMRAALDRDEDLSPAERNGLIREFEELKKKSATYNALQTELAGASRRMGEAAGVVYALDPVDRPNAVLLVPHERSSDQRNAVDIAAFVPASGDNPPKLVVVEAKGGNGRLIWAEVFDERKRRWVNAQQGSAQYLRRTLKMDRNLTVLLDDPSSVLRACGIDPESPRGGELIRAVGELVQAHRNGALEIEYRVVRAREDGTVAAGRFDLTAAPEGYAPVEIDDIGSISRDLRGGSRAENATSVSEPDRRRSTTPVAGTPDVVGRIRDIDASDAEMVRTTLGLWLNSSLDPNGAQVLADAVASTVAATSGSVEVVVVSEGSAAEGGRRRVAVIENQPGGASRRTVAEWELPAAGHRDTHGADTHGTGHAAADPLDGGPVHYGRRPDVGNTGEPEEPAGSGPPDSADRESSTTPDVAESAAEPGDAVGQNDSTAAPPRPPDPLTALIDREGTSETIKDLRLPFVSPGQYRRIPYAVLSDVLEQSLGADLGHHLATRVAGEISELANAVANVVVREERPGGSRSVWIVVTWTGDSGGVHRMVWDVGQDSTDVEPTWVFGPGTPYDPARGAADAGLIGRERTDAEPGADARLLGAPVDGWSRLGPEAAIRVLQLLMWRKGNVDFHIDGLRTADDVNPESVREICRAVSTLDGRGRHREVREIEFTVGPDGPVSENSVAHYSRQPGWGTITFSADWLRDPQAIADLARRSAEAGWSYEGWDRRPVYAEVARMYGFAKSDQIILGGWKAAESALLHLYLSDPGNPATNEAFRAWLDTHLPASSRGEPNGVWQVDGERAFADAFALTVLMGAAQAGPLARAILSAPSSVADGPDRKGRAAPEPAQDEWAGLNSESVGKKLQATMRTILGDDRFTVRDFEQLDEDVAREIARAVVAMGRLFREVGFEVLKGTKDVRTVPVTDSHPKWAGGADCIENMSFNMELGTDPRKFRQQVAALHRGFGGPDLMTRSVYVRMVEEYVYVLDQIGHGESGRRFSRSVAAYYEQNTDGAKSPIGLLGWLREHFSGQSFIVRPPQDRYEASYLMDPDAAENLVRDPTAQVFQSFSGYRALGEMLAAHTLGIPPNGPDDLMLRQMAFEALGIGRRFTTDAAGQTGDGRVVQLTGAGSPTDAEASTGAAGTPGESSATGEDDDPTDTATAVRRQVSDGLQRWSGSPKDVALVADRVAAIATATAGAVSVSVHVPGTAGIAHSAEVSITVTRSGEAGRDSAERIVWQLGPDSSGVDSVVLTDSGPSRGAWDDHEHRLRAHRARHEFAEWLRGAPGPEWLPREQAEDAKLAFAELYNHAVMCAPDHRVRPHYEFRPGPNGGLRVQVTHDLPEGQAVVLPPWTAQQHDAAASVGHGTRIVSGYSDRNGRDVVLGRHERSVTYWFVIENGGGRPAATDPTGQPSDTNLAGRRESAAAGETRPRSASGAAEVSVGSGQVDSDPPVFYGRLPTPRNEPEGDGVQASPSEPAADGSQEPSLAPPAATDAVPGDVFPDGTGPDRWRLSSEQARAALAGAAELEDIVRAETRRVEAAIAELSGTVDAGKLSSDRIGSAEAIDAMLRSRLAEYLLTPEGRQDTRIAELREAVSREHLDADAVRTLAETLGVSAGPLSSILPGGQRRFAQQVRAAAVAELARLTARVSERESSHQFDRAISDLAAPIEHLLIRAEQAMGGLRSLDDVVGVIRGLRTELAGLAARDWAAVQCEPILSRLARGEITYPDVHRAVAAATRGSLEIASVLRDAVAESERRVVEAYGESSIRGAVFRARGWDLADSYSAAVAGLPQDIGSRRANGDIREQVEEFMRSVPDLEALADPANTLYYHFTPNIGAIAAAGVLKSGGSDGIRRMTGDHSVGVHFIKPGTWEGSESYGTYFQYAAAQETFDTRSPISDALGAIVVLPLADIVANTPIRSEVKTTSPNGEHQASDATFRPDDRATIFSYQLDKAYIIPCYDTHQVPREKRVVVDPDTGRVVAARPYAEPLKDLLRDKGYEESWIAEHVIDIPDGLFRTPLRELDPGTKAKMRAAQDEIQVRLARSGEYSDGIVIPAAVQHGRQLETLDKHGTPWGGRWFSIGSSVVERLTIVGTAATAAPVADGAISSDEVAHESRTDAGDRPSSQPSSGSVEGGKRSVPTENSDSGYSGRSEDESGPPVYYGARPTPPSDPGDGAERQAAATSDAAGSGGVDEADRSSESDPAVESGGPSVFAAQRDAGRESTASSIAAEHIPVPASAAPPVLPEGDVLLRELAEARVTVEAWEASAREAFGHYDCIAVYDGSAVSGGQGNRIWYSANQHSKDPGHPQFLVMHREFQEFAGLPGKKVVLCEGDPLPGIEKLGLGAAIRKDEAAGLLYVLADRYGIEARSWNIRPEEFVRSSDPGQESLHHLYMFMNRTHHLQPNGEGSSEPDRLVAYEYNDSDQLFEYEYNGAVHKVRVPAELVEWVENYHRDLSAHDWWPRPGGPQAVRITDMLRWHHEWQGMPFSMTTAAEQFISPNREGTPVNRISRFRSDERDRAMMETVFRLAREGYSIFSESGSSHYPAQKSSVDRVLGKPFAIFRHGQLSGYDGPALPTTEEILDAQARLEDRIAAESRPGVREQLEQELQTVRYLRSGYGSQMDADVESDPRMQRIDAQRAVVGATERVVEDLFGHRSCVAVYRGPQGNLLFVSAERHTKLADDPQYGVVRRVFEQFAALTGEKVVLLEGGRHFERPVDSMDLDDVVRKYSNGTHLYALARCHNIRAVVADNQGRDFRISLGPEKEKLQRIYNFLLKVSAYHGDLEPGGWNAGGVGGSGSRNSDFPAVDGMADLPEGFRKLLERSWWTPEQVRDILLLYREHLGEPFHMGVPANILVSPNRDGTVINEYSRWRSNIREILFLDSFHAAASRGAHAFLGVGGSHFTLIRGLFDETFGEPIAVYRPGQVSGYTDVYPTAAEIRTALAYYEARARAATDPLRRSLLEEQRRTLLHLGADPGPASPGSSPTPWTDPEQRAEPATLGASGNSRPAHASSAMAAIDDPERGYADVVRPADGGTGWRSNPTPWTQKADTSRQQAAGPGTDVPAQGGRPASEGRPEPGSPGDNDSGLRTEDAPVPIVGEDGPLRLRGRQALDDLVARYGDQIVFHGSANAIDELEPRQTSWYKNGQRYNDGAPALCADDSYDIPMFMALFKGHGRYGYALSTDGGFEFFADNAGTEEATGYIGYVHVMDKQHFELMQLDAPEGWPEPLKGPRPSELRSTTEVRPFAIVEITMDEFPHPIGNYPV